MATELDAERLAGLVNIGVDEVSWRKHHKYLTLVTDHVAGKVVWGKAGKDAATLDEFFTELGAEQAGQLETVSMDMGPAFAKSVTEHAPQATIAIDPFHAVKLVTEALDVVRRQTWNELRDLDADAARKFKGARWALLKRPDNLTDEQASTLRKLRRRGGDVWRAYGLKEAFRAIFAGDLDTTAVTELLDRWICKASRSRLPAFVKAAKTIRKFRDGILTAIRTGINNGRAEGLNCVVRLIIRRARGFHSAEAALRPRHAHLWTDHPSTTPRTRQGSPRMTHTYAGRATFRPSLTVRAVTIRYSAGPFRGSRLGARQRSCHRCRSVQRTVRRPRP